MSYCYHIIVPVDGIVQTSESRNNMQYMIRSQKFREVLIIAVVDLDIKSSLLQL